jgi:8-oxo-dGTP diphosphatase
MNKLVKCGLVIHRDNKFLINRKRGTKLFLMPGGKPKAGEAPEDCLARELKEEHNVELVRESVKIFGEFEDVAANEPDTIISIKLYTGEIIGEPTVNAEVEEQRWFGKKDDPEILSPIIKNKIVPALINAEII